MKTAKLLPASNYIADLTSRVNAATERVFITSLLIADDTATHELIEALIVARQRGVEVNISVDEFTFS